MKHLGGTHRVRWGGRNAAWCNTGVGQSRVGLVVVVGIYQGVTNRAVRGIYKVVWWEEGRYYHFLSTDSVQQQPRGLARG